PPARGALARPRRGRALRCRRAGLPAATGRQQRAHGHRRAARLRGAQRVPEVLRARCRVSRLRQLRRGGERSHPRPQSGGALAPSGRGLRLSDAHRAQAPGGAHPEPRGGPRGGADAAGASGCARARGAPSGAAVAVVKRLEELDHYELLEVPRDARREEIERAYELVRAAYSGDSLAAYSVFEDDEAVALRERIERAYRVLSDPAARNGYDAMRSDPLAGGALPPDARVAVLELEELAEGERAPIPVAPPPRPAKPELGGFEELDTGDETDWDGARLRRARLLRGVELDELAAVTKI